MKQNPKRQKAILLRQNNPCMSMQDIANHLNLSRERIRQFLKEGGLRTKANPIKPLYQCNQCGGGFIKGYGMMGKGSTDRNMFCSTDCRKRYITGEFTCDYCGILFERKYSEIQNNLRAGYGHHIFCGKKCQGLWLASNHGFDVHPEHRRKRAYDHDLIYKVYQQSGLGARSLSKITGISEYTIYSVIRKRETDTND